MPPRPTSRSRVYLPAISMDSLPSAGQPTYPRGRAVHPCGRLVASSPTIERPRVTIDPKLLDDLEWRGLLALSTDRDALRTALSEGSVRFYVGFDPTAPSLHMGNLVQILTARRLQQAGH